MNFRDKIREQQLLDKLNIERKFTPELLPTKEEDNVFKAFETIEKSDMSPTGAVSAMASPKGNIEKALDTVDSLLGEDVVNDIIEKGKKGNIGEVRLWGDGRRYRKTKEGWELVMASSDSAASKKKEDFEIDQKIPLGKDSMGKMAYGIVKEKVGDKWKVQMDSGGHVTLTTKELKESAKESLMENDKKEELVEPKWEDYKKINDDPNDGRNAASVYQEDLYQYARKTLKNKTGKEPSEGEATELYDKLNREGKNNRTGFVVGSKVTLKTDSDMPTSFFDLKGQTLEVVGVEVGTLSVPQFLQVKGTDGKVRLINPNYVSKK